MTPKQPSLADASQLAQALEAAIRLAGAAILDLYIHPEHAVRTKKDSSPVTDADLASHDLIVPAIERLTPSWPVISEEDIEQDRTLDLRSPFWLVDPLDGTKEFIARTGEFSINIGLVIDQEPVLGLIYSPTQGMLYRGGVGLAAARKKMQCGFAAAEPDGPWQDISCRQRPLSGGVVISSRRSTSLPGDVIFERRDYLGSALKFAAIACGAADVYLRRGHTMEWDTCAGQAIIEAAGGSVRSLTGSRLFYGKKKLLNDGFMAQGLPAENENP